MKCEEGAGKAIGDMYGEKSGNYAGKGFVC